MDEKGNKYYLQYICTPVHFVVVVIAAVVVVVVAVAATGFVAVAASVVVVITAVASMMFTQIEHVYEIRWKVLIQYEYAVPTSENLSLKVLNVEAKMNDPCM